LVVLDLLACSDIEFFIQVVPCDVTVVKRDRSPDKKPYRKKNIGEILFFSREQIFFRIIHDKHQKNDLDRNNKPVAA
jgi:hypothetical protein